MSERVGACGSYLAVAIDNQGTAVQQQCSSAVQVCLLLYRTCLFMCGPCWPSTSFGGTGGKKPGMRGDVASARAVEHLKRMIVIR